MKYETTLDFTAPIKASMHEIEHTLIEALILVLIVVYLFLQSFRATIIQVSGPVIAMSLILCAVFVPVAFMVGVTGQLYQQFALTIAVAVVFSAINALTLSPALCAMLLKRPTPARGPLGWFFGQFNRGFNWITS